MFATIVNFTAPQTGNWLVNIIMWLVTISGSVGLGVILFTLLLKIVTLPFDFVSKYKMRKNSVKMEEMRPELEKLQKQYAGDKALYNQKMMALYKKNGYSMWGACLPTLLTLVIFIVAISAFSTYSQYQNRKYFADMASSFNGVVYDGFVIDEDCKDYVYRTEDGIVFKDQKIFADGKDSGVITINDKDGNYKYELIVSYYDKTGENDIPDGKIDTYSVTTTGSYVTLYKSCNQEGTEFGAPSYELFSDNFGLLKNSKGQTYTEFEEAKKVEITASITDKVNGDETVADADKPAKIAELVNAELEKLPAEFLLDIQQTKSAETFRECGSSFLWIKNIWVADSAMKHPIEVSHSAFNQSFGANIREADYNNLVAKLDVEKNQANGYFILVALTILTSFLMQWLTSKSQKAQMELQTVDGQGSQTNKIMMWMMPIMMAIFAFIYTAAFSLYIVLSNVFSVVSTLFINWIVGRKFKKVKIQQASEVVRGRVYNAPQEEKTEKKKGFFKKKEEPVQNDFLSGTADKKRPRGRLK